MKSAKKHTLSLYRSLVILSGIVLFSILPPDIHPGEYGYSHYVQHETEYSLVNGDNSPADEDSKLSNTFIDLVFKETTEKKDSSADANGFAVLKHGVTTIEVAFVKLSLDSSFLYKRPGNLLKEYTPDIKNQPAYNSFVSLLPLAGGISINAP